MRAEKYALRAAIFSAVCLCMVCATAGELAFPGAVGFGVRRNLDIPDGDVEIWLAKHASAVECKR